MFTVPLEFATDYIASSIPNAVQWESADETVRQQFLNAAAFVINKAFQFVDDFSLNTPDDLKIAVCFQTVWMMRYPDRFPEALTKGLSNASAGALSAAFSKDFVAPMVCDDAILAVGSYGEYIFQTNSIKSHLLGI
ncbi:MAG: hypothetical protein LBT46_15380 [Planctomycetaceae bacterium]|jgi:hypothetical protein|nr:hypothetical protein [Planctomycetaceae bacterium]